MHDGAPGRNGASLEELCDFSHLSHVHSAEHQIIQWLYRENRFCRGILKVNEALVGPSNLSVPTLAVVTMTDDVAPLASVKPCIDAMPTTGVRIIQYPGEVGVGLQHLGILVGRQARAHVWPEIISWINTS
jgi:polyhydroxyalkanoate synthase